MKASLRLYKRLYESFIKALQKELYKKVTCLHVDFLTTLCILSKCD